MASFGKRSRGQGQRGLVEYRDRDLSALTEWELLDLALCGLLASDRPENALQRATHLVFRFPGFIPGIHLLLTCMTYIWAGVGKTKVLREDMLNEAIEVIDHINGYNLTSYFDPSAAAPHKGRAPPRQLFPSLRTLKSTIYLRGPSSHLQATLPPVLQAADPVSLFAEILDEIQITYFAGALRRLRRHPRITSQLGCWSMLRTGMRCLRVQDERSTPRRQQGPLNQPFHHLLYEAVCGTVGAERACCQRRMDVYEQLFEKDHEMLLSKRLAVRGAVDVSRAVPLVSKDEGTSTGTGAEGWGVNGASIFKGGRGTLIGVGSLAHQRGGGAQADPTGKGLRPAEQLFSETGPTRMRTSVRKRLSKFSSGRSSEDEDDEEEREEGDQFGSGRGLGEGGRAGLLAQTRALHSEASMAMTRDTATGQRLVVLPPLKLNVFQNPGFGPRPFLNMKHGSGGNSIRRPAVTGNPNHTADVHVYRVGDMLLVRAAVIRPAGPTAVDNKKMLDSYPLSEKGGRGGAQRRVVPGKATRDHARPLVLLPWEIGPVLEQSIRTLAVRKNVSETSVRRNGRWQALAEYVLQVRST